ncbi:MAG: SRPBCC family protein [Kiloniellales bacterium]
MAGPLTRDQPLDPGGSERAGPGKAARENSVPRGERRRQLVEATIASIAKFGLSNTTLSKVTQIAGLSPGIVSFYFNSKDALLLATLRYVAEEYEQAWNGALIEAGPDPAAQLLAAVEVNFDPQLSDPHRIAVWHAFWSEARAREEYLKLCGDRDAAYYEQTLALCQRIIDDGSYRHLDAEAIAHAVEGMIDSAWQSMLFTPENYDRSAALRSCRAFLASIFPHHFAMPAKPGESALDLVGTAAATEPQPAGSSETPGATLGPTPGATPGATGAAPWTGLPAWTYDNAALHALERERLFQPSWQLVCHVSNLPRPGDYATLDLLDERVIVVRGEDDAVRAFHNVCRHRAHALAEEAFGSCPGVLRCTYHGWSYHLDGRLKAVPAPETFPGLDFETHGLVPIELEVFLGFVHVRLRGGGPSLAEIMAPLAAELAPYRFEELQPYERLWQRELAADWKIVWDNYLESYHFTTSHPGLYDLIGADTAIVPLDGGLTRLSNPIRDKPARHWSARAYQRLLPEVEHLPPALRRRWSVFPQFPGVSFGVYPDRVDYLQILPLGPGRTLLRSHSYALPDDRRAMRAARYLGLRLVDRVQAEDEALILSVQRGLRSAVHGSGLLSEQEVMLRAFHDWIRERLPVTCLAEPPSPASLATRNAAMLG